MRYLVLMILAVAVPHAALADEWDEEPDEPYTAETWPTELVRRPLTPAEGMWEIDALANVNLTKGEIGEPISLAPGVVYGITNRLAFGLEHVQGLCLSGVESACPYIYNDAAVTLRWSALRQGPWEIALRGGFAAQFEPAFRADAVLRMQARWRRGRVALTAEPFVNVGLTDRDVNRTLVGVSGRPEVQVTHRLAVYGLVKLFGVVDDFGATYLIHSGLGGLVGLGSFDLGGQVVFPALLGPNDAAFVGLGKLDQREVQLYGSVRF
jgi:hypothetical protein